MTGIQDLIYKLEEGSWGRYIKMGTLFLMLLALVTWYDLREYKNFGTQEAMDQAQLARNLAQGRGYVTDFVRPLDLKVLQEKNPGVNYLKTGVPDISNPPAYSGLLALWMKVVPFHYEPTKGVAFLTYQPERMIMVLNQLLFAFSTVLLFFLARRLFDAQVAWLTVIVFAGADFFWKLSVSGLPAMLLITLVLLLAHQLAAIEEAARIEAEPPPVPVEGEPVAPVVPNVVRSAGWYLIRAGLAGLCVGLLFLTRYSMGWLLVPSVLFLAFAAGARRWLTMGVVLAVFLGLALPWIVRNQSVCGLPFGSTTYALMMETPTWPETRLERTLTGKIQLVESDDYIRKFMVNSAQIIEEEIPRLGGSWVSCLFLAALLVPFQRPALRKFRWWIVGNMLVLWVAQSLIRTHLSKDSPLLNSENLLVVAAPLAFIFGCGLFTLLLDQFDWNAAAARSLATGLFCIIACAPLIYAVLPPRTFPMAYPPYYPPQIRVCTEMMEKDELMMSDVPWALAWYGQRQSIWLTLDLKTDFFQLNDNMKPVKALYLTSLTTDAKFNSHFTEGQDAAWNRFYLDAFVRKNIPAGFPLNNAPSGFLPEQLMLTDHRRWR